MTGKGTRRERQAADLYKQAGYAVYRPATVQFGENDIFGLFDLLAVSPCDPRVHAVQVKSNRASGVRAWCRHTSLWRSLGWLTRYLVPVDGEGWRLIEAGDGGHTTVFDGRECDGNMGEGLVEFLRGDD